jgi:hypothetical protein
MRYNTEIELCWNSSYSYREATFEKLLAQTGEPVEHVSRGRTVAYGVALRSVTFATRLSRNEILNMYLALDETYVLEYIDIRWDPPYWIWQLRDWLQEHRFHGASRWIESAIDRVSSWLQPS